MKGVKSLNEVYEKNLIFYWCNASGEINVPGADPLYVGCQRDLPFEQRVLYGEFQKEDDPCRYVVTYKGKAAMALGLLFDYDWLSTLMCGVEGKDDPLVKAAKGLLGYAIKRYGKWYLKAQFPDTEVLFGEDTDPDGHELLVVVPFEKRDIVTQVAAVMADSYALIAKDFGGLCGDLASAMGYVIS